MSLSKTEAKRIKPYLDKDFRQKIAEKVGCHVNTVQNVMTKEANNYKVENALVDMAEANIQKEQLLKKRIKKLPIYS